MTNTMTAFTPARPSSPSHCPPPYFLPSDLQLDLGARINGRSPSTTPSPEVQSLNTPSPHNAPSPAINPSDHGGDAAGDAKDDEPGTADTTAPSSVRMEPSITASRAPSVMTRMREWQVIQGDLEMQARLDQEREAGQQGREEQSTGSSASANDHRSCYMCWASSPRHEQPLTSPPAVSPTLPEPTPAVATRSTTNYTGDLVESSDEYVPDRRRNWTSGPAELMTPIGSQRLSSVARREIMNIARAQARRDRAWTAGNAEDSSDEEVEYGRMGGLFHRNLYTSNAWDAYPIDNDHQHSAIPAIARPANTREAARDDREHHDNGADVNAADASNESILPSLSPVSVRDFFNYGLGFSDEEAEVLRERDDMQRQQQAAVPGQAQPAPSVADPADSPVIPNNQSSLRVSRDAGDKATAPARPMNANAGMSFQYHHAPRHQQMAHQMGQTPGQQLPYRRQAEFTGTQQITAYQPVHDFLSFSAQFGSMGLNDMLHADRGQFFAGAHAAGYDSQRQANFTGRRTAQPGSRPTSHRNAMQTPNQREHHGDRGPWRHQPVRSLDARNMQGQQHTPRLSDPFAPSYTLQSAPPVHQQYAPLPNSRPSTGSQTGGPNRQMYDTEFPALGRGGSGHPEATRRERARRTPHRHIEAPRPQQQQPKLPQLHQSAALSVNAPTFVPNNQTGALTSSGAAAHALMAYRDAQEHLEAAMREERYWQQQVQQGGNAFAILAHRAYQERGTRREIRMHPNDWLCPMPECGYHNFARNNYCKQCHLHPVTGQVDPKTEKSPPLGSPGDWKCDVCGHPNWRRREKCHGCNQGLRFLSTEYEGPGQPVYLRYVHSAHLILGNKQPPQLSELEVRIVAAMVRQVYPEHPFCQGVPLPDEAWLEPYQMGHDGSSMFPFNPMAIDAERPGGSVFDHDQYTSNALGYGTAGESSRTGAAMMAMQQGLMPSAQIAQSHSSSQHDQKETEDADDEDDEDDEEEECKSLKGKGKSKSAGSGSKGSRGSKESTGRASL